MKDITEKYQNMIEAFECDFANIDEKIQPNAFGENKIRIEFPITEKLFNDIKLLEELSFDIRHGKVKIMGLSFELIEDDEIDIQSIGEFESEKLSDKTFIIDERIFKINQLIRAVKQLDKKMKEKE